MEPGEKYTIDDRAFKKVVANFDPTDPSDEHIYITTQELIHFGDDDQRLYSAAYRARNKVEVVGFVPTEDLNPSDFYYGKPTIMVLKKKPTREQLVVEWVNPIKAGDFEYCKNEMEDVSLRYKDEPLWFGPKANKIVGYLLDHEGKLVIAEDVSIHSGCPKESLRQRVSKINEKFGRQLISRKEGKYTITF